MKYFFFFILSLFLLFSCKDNGEEIFEIDYEVDVVYEAGLNQFEVYYIDSYDINTRIEEYLTANGRSIEDISQILPKSAEIVNLQTSVSLEFINNLRLDIFEGSQFFPEEKENETEIFFRNNVPLDRATFINLLPSLPDVKSFLLEDKFNISLRTEIRSAPPSTIEAKLRIKFSVL